MQAAQDRQAKMLEGLLRQRDMYKNMYQQCLKQTPEKKEFSIPEEERKEIDVIKTVKDEVSIMQDDVNREKELQRQLEENETKLKQVIDEYDTYKKERAAHERMLGDEVERLRKEAEANSARCCRLKAQLDSANDRFNLLQSNVTSYKSQIKVLEEKCFNYNVTIGNNYYNNIIKCLLYIILYIKIFLVYKYYVKNIYDLII